MTSNPSPGARTPMGPGKRNPKAIASLVAALLAALPFVPYPIFLGGIAVLLGRQAWKEIDESGGAQGGILLAKVGTLLGGLVVVFVLGGLLFAIFAEIR